jgi:hypothetical protein
MPKKDKKASKQDQTREPADIVEAVRGAVERTLQATTGGTEGARDRGRNLLDDVASAAQRIRESFDDLRVLEDVRGLRAEIEALSRRVAELEKKQAAAATPAPRAAAGTRSGTTTARTRRAPAKPSAARTAAAKTTPKATPAGDAPAKATRARRRPSPDAAS